MKEGIQKLLNLDLESFQIERDKIFKSKDEEKIKILLEAMEIKIREKYEKRK